MNFNSRYQELIGTRFFHLKVNADTYSFSPRLTNGNSISHGLFNMGPPLKEANLFVMEQILSFNS